MSSSKLMVILSTLALLCVIALVVFQYLEWKTYIGV